MPVVVNSTHTVQLALALAFAFTFAFAVLGLYFRHDAPRRWARGHAGDGLLAIVLGFGFGRAQTNTGASSHLC
jgi:hypothetical protein